MRIPDDVKAVLDEKVFAHLATVNPDGSPHVSVVWIGRRGDTLLFSTVRGRVKPRNLTHEPRVAVSLTPPDEPYRNIVMRGRVTRTAEDGNWLIDELACKYLGHESYQFAAPGEVRINYEIDVDSVGGWE